VVRRSFRPRQTGAIGWDIAIDESWVPHILEINTFHPGIFIIEALAGPCFVRFGWERFAAGRTDGSPTASAS